jgi:hypothetical protein
LSEQEKITRELVDFVCPDHAECAAPLAEDEVLLIMELNHVADAFGKDEKPKMVNRIMLRANCSAPGLLL